MNDSVTTQNVTFHNASLLRSRPKRRNGAETRHVTVVDCHGPRQVVHTLNLLPHHGPNVVAVVQLVKHMGL